VDSENTLAAASAPDSQTPPSEPAEPQKPAPPSVPGERLLVYTPRGPLIIDVFVTINGQPYQTSRERMLVQIVKAADGDEDGQSTWEELWADPTLEQMEAARNPSQNNMERDRRRRTYDRNGDGLVNGTEAEQFLSRLIGPPAALTLVRSNLRDMQSYRSRIRDLLDDDGDGYLSAEEWKAAPAVLARRDADRDELVDVTELSDTPYVPENLQAPMRDMSYDNQLPPQAELLDSRVLWASIYVTMRELYLADGELGKGSFPLTPSLAGQLDLSENGRIDKEELKRLTRVPPHLELDLRYGRITAENDKLGLSVRRISPELSGVQTKPLSDGLGVQIELPGVALQLRAQDFTPGDDFAEAAKQALAQLDKDNNGYIDEEEAAESEQFMESMFQTADADEDGKLYPAEIEKYLAAQQAPSFNRVQVEATDPEDALFAALDVNADNRLGPREIQRAAERLKSLDANGDGKILADEVTSAVLLSFNRGENQPQGAPRVNRLAPRERPADPNLPRWFVGMDRNADGDVSRAEFLGTSRQFSHLDSNADGFISGDEALAASAGS
jgi:Ca2+-binding EF-hand superfamily protein